ncbi:MAG: type VII secretion protein EccB, partial [Actinobacteria bacterium]|nr:type VII secretion protein EccB [Actinomycetota bacterium]
AAAGRSSTVCATLAADGTGVTSTVDLRAASPRGVVVGGSGTAATGADRTARADEVFVPPGRGAIVRESVGAGFATSATYLVTDQGTKYPLPDARALDVLGYRGTTVTVAPKAVLDLLPTGPALDPAGVAAPVGG